MKHINNLYSYLKSTCVNEMRIPTTYVNGCWDDVEFDANAAGFSIVRYIDKEREQKHLFAECYHIKRK